MNQCRKGSFSGRFYLKIIVWYSLSFVNDMPDETLNLWPGTN